MRTPEPKVSPGKKSPPKGQYPGNESTFSLKLVWTVGFVTYNVWPFVKLLPFLINVWSRVSFTHILNTNVYAYFRSFNLTVNVFFPQVLIPWKKFAYHHRSPVSCIRIWKIFRTSDRTRPWAVKATHLARRPALARPSRGWQVNKGKDRTWYLTRIITVKPELTTTILRSTFHFL